MVPHIPKATACVLLALSIAAGQASTARSPSRQSSGYVLPTKMRQPPKKKPHAPPKRAAAHLLAQLDAPSIGYFMDYGRDLKRLFDSEQGDLGFAAIQWEIEESIRRKLPRSDRENARIEALVSTDSTGTTYVFATRFSLEAVRRFQFDLASILPMLGKEPISVDLPVRHRADYLIGFDLSDHAEQAVKSELDDEHLFVKVDEMASEIAVSLPQEGDDGQAPTWAAWHPMRMGRLRGFGRVQHLELSANIDFRLDGQRPVRLSEMSDDLWSGDTSVSIKGELEFCGSRDCGENDRMLLHFGIDDASDTARLGTVEVFDCIVDFPRMKVAEGFVLDDFRLEAYQVHSDDENPKGKPVFSAAAIDASLHAANGPRFRILPDPEQGYPAIDGLYDPHNDSLDLTLYRLEFDLWDGLAAQARDVPAGHSPRMKHRQPWLAVDTLWVRRRGTSEESSFLVAATPARRGKAHLLTVSAAGAEIDYATIRKALATGRQKQGQ